MVKIAIRNVWLMASSFSLCLAVDSGLLRRDSGLLRRAYAAGNVASVVDSSGASASYHTAQKRPTVYCFSLMRTESEKTLLTWQYKTKRGIFLCDGFAVYSNPVTQIGSLTTNLLDMNLTAVGKGEYGNSLNVRQFRALWSKVLADKHYQKFDWVAKVDADTVLFPDRIAEEIGYPEGRRWVKNCPWWELGPIEIVSKDGLDSVGDFTRCPYTDWYAEDVWFGECMENLTIPKIQDRESVMNRDCPNDDKKLATFENGHVPRLSDNRWQDCTEYHPAFHPHKTIQDFEDCYKASSHARQQK